MAAWKAGKVLWFDKVAGEGLVVDEKGTPYYVHQGAIQKSKNKKPSKLKDNARVKFTIYENAYLTQVDKIKEI